MSVENIARIVCIVFTISFHNLDITLTCLMALLVNDYSKQFQYIQQGLCILKYQQVIFHSLSEPESYWYYVAPELLSGSLRYCSVFSLPGCQHRVRCSQNSRLFQTSNYTVATQHFMNMLILVFLANLRAIGILWGVCLSVCKQIYMDESVSAFVEWNSMKVGKLTAEAGADADHLIFPSNSK